MPALGARPPQQGARPPQCRRSRFTTDTLLKPGIPDGFRKQCLERLVSSKSWVPRAQRPPTHQNITAFDWDDTLLCTSFLNGVEYNALPQWVVNDLAGIQRAGKELLERAAGLGPTFVITNAEEGWVQESAAEYIPEVLDVLTNHKVRVISARTNNEQYEVDQWKINAFLGVQQSLNSNVLTNLMSMGDSNFERDAAWVMAEKFAQVRVKTLKFYGRPSPEQLLRQLRLVTEKWEFVVGHAEDTQMILNIDK